MGEATYYLKARFKDNAPEAELTAFFEEGSMAEDFWQKHRGMDRDGTRAQFWTAFKEQFPTVYDFLPETLRDGDCNNALASKLNFGNSDSRIMHFDGNEFRVSAM